MSIKDELLQEKRRQDLLHSIDPEEVRQGKEMVTPASIFEALATPDMVASEVDVEDMHSSAREEDGDEEAGDGYGDFGGVSDPGEALTAEQREGIESFGKQLQALSGTNYFLMEMTKSTRQQEKKKSSKAVQLSLWLPLTFPAIPKKGNFDVTMLKESKYFFS